MASSKLKINSTSYKMPLGKHKGKRIGDLIVNDPQYCEWLFTQPFVQVSKPVTNALETHLSYAR